MTRTFCNDLAHSLLNARKVTRGKSSLDVLAEKALEHAAERIIIADRWKGGVGKIQLFTLGDAGLEQFYPILYVKNVKLRKMFKEAHPRKAKLLVLQTEPKASLEAYELSDALADFFRIAKQSSEEALTSATQRAMHISLNKSRQIQITFLQTSRKVEVGPRVTLSHLVWKSQK